jgi:hypothetical protein
LINLDIQKIVYLSSIQAKVLVDLGLPRLDFDTPLIQFSFANFNLYKHARQTAINLQQLDLI